MYTNDTEKLFAEGGMNQQGGTVDPVSGNDVPAGSLQKEVRDDIPAQLSEGEFVLPADVVRYIGLDRLMKLRDKAKEGLAKMEEIGQMGNAEEAVNPEAPHGDEFSSEIDDIISETENEEATNNLAVGGMPTPTGTSTGIEVKQFKQPNGNSMFITFINGSPASPIPEGAQEITVAKESQKAEDALTNTEKAVNIKTALKEAFTSSQEDFDKKLDKALFDKITQYSKENKSKETTNKPAEPEPSIKYDDELMNVSEALDYSLTEDMNSGILSSELNKEFEPSSMTTPEPEPEIEPPLLAKGGLVSRRKK